MYTEHRPRASSWTKISDRNDYIGEAWQTLLKDWWATSKLEEIKAMPMERRLLVIPSAVQTELLVQRNTKGILLREESIWMAKQLQGAYEQRIPGVALTGQPGSGKTYMLPYLLLEQMAMSCPTMFTVGLKTTYLIDEDGVWSHPTENLHSQALPRYPNKRIWSLIDSDSDSTQTTRPSRVLTVYAFPVYSARHEITSVKWCERNGALMWILNPWTDIRELAACIRADMRFHDWLSPEEQQQHMSPEGLRSLVEICGPCPKDIHTVLFYETGPMPNKLESMQEALRLFAYSRFASNTLTSSAVILLRASDSLVHDHKFMLDFKSAHAEDLFTEKWYTLTSHEAKKMSYVCGGSPERNVLAGWVFKSVSHWHIICDLQDILGNFGLMKTAAPLVSSVPARFVDQDNAEDVFLVCETGSLVLKNTDPRTVIQNCASQNPSSTFTALPIPATNFVSAPYANINNHVDVDPSKYYMAVKHDNALFDAFFFQLLPGKIIIWILQMTRSRRRGAFSVGYEHVKALREKAEKFLPKRQISLNYVLVVPSMQRRVVWDMPEGYLDPAVKGAVYIQYIDYDAVMRSSSDLW